MLSFVLRLGRIDCSYYTKEMIQISETGESEPVSKKLVLNIFASTSFWIMFFLLIASFIVAKIDFLSQIPQDRMSAALITKSAVNFKMQEWKHNHDRADLVVVGSSLLMCCLYYADDPKNSLVLNRMNQKNQNPLQAYTAADYLQKAVTQKKGSSYRVFNATVAASMISDVYLLVSKMLDKPPKTIILGVGLRDFADNINCSFGATPTYQALFDVPYVLSRDNLAFTFSNASKSVPQELLSCLIFPMYRNHLEMGLAPFLFAEKLFKKDHSYSSLPTSKNDTESGAKSDVESTTVVEEKPVLDTLGYEKRYMPANYKQMNLESKSLERLCKLCQDEKIELILINMPVSSGHQALCSKEMRSRYLQTLEQVSTKYGIKYLDFENKNLVPDKDFIDTVHMGPSGATKFLDYLVSQSGIFAY